MMISFAPGALRTRSSSISVTVRTGAQVSIRGPATLVLGSLLTESGSVLQLDPTNGPVTLYVETVEWLYANDKDVKQWIKDNNANLSRKHS